MSDAEELLMMLIRQEGLPLPVREYRFCERRWRFDFAWPDERLAVEVEGGSWTQGRHTRGNGFRRDCIKYNRAAMDGWTVLRFTGDQVTNGMALEAIRRVLRERAETHDTLHC